jgi:AraC-like DNA-binding protein
MPSGSAIGFEAESMFARVAARRGKHLGDRRDDDIEPGASIGEELRDLLDARLSAGVTLAEAGRILEVSPAHLVRSFTHRFGISPHRYLVGRRIEAARRRLLDGLPVARVAADVRFHDQAHFTGTSSVTWERRPARTAVAEKRRASPARIPIARSEASTPWA